MQDHMEPHIGILHYIQEVTNKIKKKKQQNHREERMRQSRMYQKSHKISILKNIRVTLALDKIPQRFISINVRIVLKHLKITGMGKKKK